LSGNGKTDFFVKEIARGSHMVCPLCPCAHCKKRQRQGKFMMGKHLWLYGYMADFTMPINFAKHERAREEVMQQHIGGNDDDGIRNMLDGIRHVAMPNLPPPDDGMRTTPSIGLVEVMPSNTYHGADVFVVAH
jgi:hypothetical protein